MQPFRIFNLLLFLILHICRQQQETLTGFKWMANKAVELMSQGNTVLLAFEEAIGKIEINVYTTSIVTGAMLCFTFTLISGYMCGTNVLDKDGISAAVLMAEAAVHLEQQGKTLYDQLQTIFQTYGYHPCINSYYLCYCPDTIQRMFHRLRNFNGPNTVRLSTIGHSCVLFYLHGLIYISNKIIKGLKYIW